MKRRSYFFYVFILLFCFIINQAIANPTAFWPVIEDPIMRTFFLFFLFFLGSGIEYGVFRHSFSTSRSRYNKDLLKSCFKVNLITFPLTQILAYIVYIYLKSYLWVYLIIIEILVVISEWGLFKIEFGNIFEERIVSQKILFGSMKANSLSFLLSFLAFFFYLF